MKMINVLNMMSKNEIKEGMLLKFIDEKYVAKQAVFEFSEGYFYHKEGQTLEEIYSLDANFLNREVELITQQKKYLIKFNMNELGEYRRYLVYDVEDACIMLSTDEETLAYRTQFTKEEMHNIKPINNFLENMHGLYELVEVK